MHKRWLIASVVLGIGVAAAQNTNNVPAGGNTGVAGPAGAPQTTPAPTTSMPGQTSTRPTSQPGQVANPGTTTLPGQSTTTLPGQIVGSPMGVSGSTAGTPPVVNTIAGPCNASTTGLPSSPVPPPLPSAATTATTSAVGTTLAGGMPPVSGSVSGASSVNGPTAVTPTVAQPCSPGSPAPPLPGTVGATPTPTPQL